AAAPFGQKPSRRPRPRRRPSCRHPSFRACAAHHPSLLSSSPIAPPIHPSPTTPDPCATHLSPCSAPSLIKPKNRSPPPPVDPVEPESLPHPPRSLKPMATPLAMGVGDQLQTQTTDCPRDR
uniref:Uncharacterized protein n=1 Tax=Triticum urartu TaxID=4572 RepID=A0A8R7Q528_TRIUA